MAEQFNPAGVIDEKRQEIIEELEEITTLESGKNLPEQ